MPPKDINNLQDITHAATCVVQQAGQVRVPRRGTSCAGSLCYQKLLMLQVTLVHWGSTHGCRIVLFDLPWS